MSERQRPAAFHISVSDITLSERCLASSDRTLGLAAFDIDATVP